VAQHIIRGMAARVAGVTAAWLVLVSGFPAHGQSQDVLLDCTSCHDIEGRSSIPQFPVLNGQPTRYLLDQLEAYHTGEREHVQMQATARALGAEGAIPMVRMYADAPVPAFEPPEDLENHSVARALNLAGAWDRGIAPCASCHGLPEPDETVDMSGRATPRLYGQPEGYLAATLYAYADGSRQTDGMGRMQAYAARLSDSEIQAISAYFAAFTRKDDTP